VEKRDKWLHVKVSEADRTAWQAQAAAVGLTLSDLIRQRMSTDQVGRQPRRRAPRRADPALLSTLGRVGNNLNQLARWANTHKSGADAVQVLSALVAIETLLSSYRPGVSGAKPLTGEADADENL
jgi:hypothetical protein